MSFQFTFENLRKYFQTYLREGYQVIQCQDYLEYKKNQSRHKIVVNRVDIDVSPKKVWRLLEIFNQLQVKASFFIRLHANEYNPFSFENYLVFKAIRDAGHEIGYHSEVIDEAAIWLEDATFCLKRDLQILNTMLGITVIGVASHGGMTGLNNLDFWKDKSPRDFGLLYEAYDHQSDFNLFQESFYVSDSSWTYWKAYDKGRFLAGDQRTPDKHAGDGHKIIYSLIHPETYYDRHFYE